MRRLLLPCTLALGCGPDPLTGQDVCDDVVLAVAARVASCAGTSEAAEAVPDTFAGLDCLLEGQDTGVNEGFVVGYYECVGVMASVPCDQALEFQDDAEFWLNQDFHCAQVLGQAGDTGGAT